jgi:hypothetical protein
MSIKRYNILALLVSLLATMSACTGSKSETLSNVEVLSSQRVFSDDTLQASFEDASIVSSFDDSNRPLLANETMICPEVPPTDGGGSTPPTDGGGGNPPTGGGGSDDNPPPPPQPTCNAGFEYNGSICVSICKANQIFAQDKCYDKETDCDIANGEGSQQWMANMYGSCKPTHCNDGYKINGESCVAQCKEGEVYSNGECHTVVAECKDSGQTGVKIWQDNGYGKCHVSHNCKMPFGKGMERYNKQTLVYDRCEVTSCDSGYKKANDNYSCESLCKKGEVYNGKKCLPEEKPCSVAGGKGKTTWDDKRNKYGWCEVTSCDRGFMRLGNSCRRPNSDDDDDSCDPLVVDLGADINNAKGISLSSQLEGILFDILGLNSTPQAHDKKQISWTNQQRYQWVVLPDANGQVTGIDQMFGDNTMGPDGQFAAEGFAALSKYDKDKNGRIDTEDPVYKQLALWHDANGNGVSDAGELTPFSSAMIDSIDLKYDPNFYEIDIYGNKTTYKSVVQFSDGRQTLIFDMWFKFLEPTPPPTGGGSGDPGTGGGGTTDPGTGGGGTTDPGTGGGGTPNQCPMPAVATN